MRRGTLQGGHPPVPLQYHRLSADLIRAVKVGLQVPDVPAAHAVHQRAAAAVGRQRAVAVPQPGGRAPPAPRAGSPDAHALLVIVLDDLLQQRSDAQELKTLQARRKDYLGSWLSLQRMHDHLKGPNQASVFPCMQMAADKGLTSTLLAGSRCEVSGREAAAACGGDPLTD